jgi:hypothetical protein
MVTTDGRSDAVAALQTICCDLQQLEFTFRLKQHFSDADSVWAARHQLDAEIGVLIGQNIDAWNNSASATIDTINKAIVGVRESLGKIKVGFETAKVPEVNRIVGGVIGLAKTLNSVWCR